MKLLNHRSTDLASQYLHEYARLIGQHSGDFERTETALDTDDLKEWFEQRKSKTNRAIRQALGDYLARPYLIAACGKRPHTLFGLNVPAEAIRFSDDKLAGCVNKTGSRENNPT